MLQHHGCTVFSDIYESGELFMFFQINRPHVFVLDYVSLFCRLLILLFYFFIIFYPLFYV